VSTSRRWLPFYLVLALIWGCSFLFIEVGLESFTPAGVAFTRIAFGAAALIIVSAITRTPILPRWSWKYVFIASMLWASVPWMLFSFGQQYVTSAFAGIINGTTPLMTLIAIMIAFREEKPTRQRIIGLLVGFIGIVIVVGVWNLVQQEERSSLIGIGALVLAVCCYGTAFPFARRYLSGTREHPAPNPIALATGLMIGGLIVTGPAVAFTGLTRDGSVSGESLWSLVALGALGSGIAYVLNFVVVQRSDATTASTVTYLTPLVAIIVGALVLGERITWNEPIGGVLVVVGAAIAQGVLLRSRPARAR
jgi:drug/metabolite transporter (DMT)-like permease